MEIKDKVLHAEQHLLRIMNYQLDFDFDNQFRIFLEELEFLNCIFFVYK